MMNIRNTLLRYIKPVYYRISGRDKVSNYVKPQRNPLYPILSPLQEENLRRCIRVTFTGDLILLKDMVENAFDENIEGYQFDSMFAYAKRYYDEADYNIGVFEGPVAGGDKGYSTSCFGDGIPIYLNFPREYAEAVKRAGFDMVTLANNHILDQGVEGLYHTLDELDSVGLSHIGAYRNESEYERYSIVNIKGKKIALLAYTYGSNYYSTDFFYEKEHRHLTKVIVKPSDKHIDECLKSVQHDFEVVKQMSPDAIFVLPHMGKQFRHEPDDFQNYWCNVFVENGADVIFSDHPHAVQPIEWREINNKDILIVHCPGNFINSYTKKDGDASMIVECYLDVETGKPIASSCIPIYAYCKYDRHKVENYVGVPICDVVKGETSSLAIGRYEFDRISDVQELVTKVAIGEAVSIDQVQDRYFLFPDVGYVRQRVTQVKEIEKLKEGKNKLLEMIGKSRCVAFVGDSITEGTLNGGYGWFEPLMSSYKGKDYIRFAKGSETSVYFYERKSEIAKLNADVFVLAMGCNDIRYRNPKICALTASMFVENLAAICNEITAKNPDAKLVIISPWESTRFDPYCPLSVDEKNKLYAEYAQAIEDYCLSNRILYCNPNPFINKRLAARDVRFYLKDHIHCNAGPGIGLFSLGVVESACESDF